MRDTLTVHAHLTGAVVHGAGRGRGLGFPTANVAADPDSRVPPSAIYSGWVVRHSTGAVHRGTISIGSNPTFCDTADVHVEVYCHDTSDEFYGERVGLWFVARIRDTVKFASPDDLVRAARQDVLRSEALLASDCGRRVLTDALAAYGRTVSA
ncbi:riboflavin kinase [Streptomyces sp. NBC_00873]|uniref:riboflavin kinase n=1 Tax=unclassified Streptomyces TaxID=2593676 RepID=UPI00386D6C1D|nr:riboflavin kinase [Streptomyces sp. NBC_00873]WTA45477.1 riboflavin kinase [Streptomyces sp. NBC_00842]